MHSHAQGVFHIPWPPPCWSTAVSSSKKEPRSPSLKVCQKSLCPFSMVRAFQSVPNNYRKFPRGQSIRQQNTIENVGQTDKQAQEDSLPIEGGILRKKPHSSNSGEVGLGCTDIYVLQWMLKNGTFIYYNGGLSTGHLYIKMDA